MCVQNFMEKSKKRTFTFQISKRNTDDWVVSRIYDKPNKEADVFHFSFSCVAVDRCRNVWIVVAIVYSPNRIANPGLSVHFVQILRQVSERRAGVHTQFTCGRMFANWRTSYSNALWILKFWSRPPNASIECITHAKQTGYQGISLSLYRCTGINWLHVTHMQSTHFVWGQKRSAWLDWMLLSLLSRKRNLSHLNSQKRELCHRLSRQTQPQSQLQAQIQQRSKERKSEMDGWMDG